MSDSLSGEKGQKEMYLRIKKNQALTNRSFRVYQSKIFENSVWTPFESIFTLDYKHSFTESKTGVLSPHNMSDLYTNVILEIRGISRHIRRSKRNRKIGSKRQNGQMKEENTLKMRKERYSEKC